LLQIFLTQLAMKWLLKFPPHTVSASALPRKIRTSEICVENLKWSKNINKFCISGSVVPNRWSITRLTVMQQYSTRCHLRMFMNSRSDWWSLDYSGAEHHRHCYQSLCLCSHNCPTFQTFLLSAVNMDIWMNCQPKWHKSGWNMFLCVILIKQ